VLFSLKHKGNKPLTEFSYNFKSSISILNYYLEDQPIEKLGILNLHSINFE